MQDLTLAALVDHPAVVSARRRDFDYAVVLEDGGRRFSHQLSAGLLRPLTKPEVHLMIEDVIKGMRTTVSKSAVNSMHLSEPDLIKIPLDILRDLAEDKNQQPAVRL